jgi:sugar lactone lactonase YvrE
MRLRTIAATFCLSLAAGACTPRAPESSEPHGPAATNALESPQLVARFDAAAGQLPEGLVVSAETAFVGFAPTSQVMRVDLKTFAQSPWGTLPTPVAGKGFMTGLARSPTGEIYAGLASFVPEVQAGIYRIAKQGGAATLFAKDAALPFPNALAFDQDSSLFVSDSGTGSVFQIAADGSAVRWASGPLLTGDKDGCAAAGPGFAVGANGLVVERDAVYVVNMDQATLVKIPRDAQGQAGAAVIIAGPDCDALGGADGLAVAPDQSFVIAVNRQNKLVHVSRGGDVQALTSGPPLDFPASVAYGGSALYATNFAFKTASAHQPALPGLLRLASPAAP